MKGIDLKIARVYERITLKELSQAIGMSVGYLSELENDQVKITPKIVHRYVEALEKIKKNEKNA